MDAWDQKIKDYEELKNLKTPEKWEREEDPAKMYDRKKRRRYLIRLTPGN